MTARRTPPSINEIAFDCPHYGAPFATYQGSGTLSPKGGGEDPCTFTAFQMRDAQVILLVKVEPARAAPYFADNAAGMIAGTTTDGQHLTATGLFEIKRVLETARDQPELHLEYCSEKLVLENVSNEASSYSRFAIVNLILANNELTVEHPVGRVLVRRVVGYQQVAQQLQAVKGIDVTAELEVQAPEPEGRECVADDICLLLSVARGTKIQWIAREDYTPTGAWLRRYHFSRVTRRRCPLPIIDPRNIDDTPRFLATAVRTYVERREKWGLSRGLLDAYLDAKSDVDYLQTRGVKLAVAMEMLKESFLQASGYRYLVRPAPEFRAMVCDLKEALKKVMTQHGLNSQERALAYRNIAALNRVPFEDILAELCLSLQIDVPTQDRKLFVRCRNSLVHTGRFYCESADDHDRAVLPPHPGPVEEYFWLLHLMDRLLLRLVGYQGPYVDWGNVGVPVRRTNF